MARSLLLTLGQKKKVQEEADIDLDMMCLSVLKEILQRFGVVVAAEHESILTTLLGMLEHPREVSPHSSLVTAHACQTSLRSLLPLFHYHRVPALRPT
jgi:hypothetical protein